MSSQTEEDWDRLRNKIEAVELIKEFQIEDFMQKLSTAPYSASHQLHGLFGVIHLEFHRPSPNRDKAEDMVYCKSWSRLHEDFQNMEVTVGLSDLGDGDWFDVFTTKHHVYELPTDLELVKFDNLRSWVKATSELIFRVEIKVELYEADNVYHLRRVKGGRALLGDDLAKAVSLAPPDATLVCQGRTFPCHRLVLAARSEVFRAMFRHRGTVEAATGKVEIRDMEPDVCEEMLSFVYTDDLRKSLSVGAVCNLLAAADKYNIRPLAVACEEHMRFMINETNVAPMLVAAHRHGSDTFKTCIAEFMMENKDKLRGDAQLLNVIESQDGGGGVFAEISVRFRFKSPEGRLLGNNQGPAS